ncbi:hypothetical protein GCM10027425_21770 [Alteromonas gracilis]
MSRGSGCTSSAAGLGSERRGSCRTVEGLSGRTVRGGEIAHGVHLRGDEWIESWLQERAGEMVEHPADEWMGVRLDLDAPETILAALWTHARAFRWRGDSPYERRRDSCEQEDFGLDDLLR